MRKVEAAVMERVVDDATMGRSTVAVDSQPPVVTPKSRRRLRKWDDRLIPGLIPLPQAGKDSEGRPLAAALFADHPVSITSAGQEGWAVAVANTPEEDAAGIPREIINQEDYTIDSNQRMLFGDLVVMVRDMEYHQKAVQRELEDIKRRTTEIGLPKTLLEDEVEVRTIAESITRTEGPVV